MANIGIFGGSFNPPHRGHLLAAAEFQRRLRLDRVILMLKRRCRHKALAAGSPDAHTRLELTRLAAQDLPFAEVSDLELHRSGAKLYGRYARGAAPAVSQRPPLVSDGDGYAADICAVACAGAHCKARFAGSRTSRKGRRQNASGSGAAAARPLRGGRRAGGK